MSQRGWNFWNGHDWHLRHTHIWSLAAELLGGAVVLWLAQSPHREKVPGSILRWSGFLSPKSMHVRSIDESKFHRRSESSLCGALMDWWHIQGVHCPSPNDFWDRLQPASWINGYRFIILMKWLLIFIKIKKSLLMLTCIRLWFKIREKKRSLLWLSWYSKTKHSYTILC